MYCNMDLIKDTVQTTTYLSMYSVFGWMQAIVNESHNKINDQQENFYCLWFYGYLDLLLLDGNQFHDENSTRSKFRTTCSPGSDEVPDRQDRTPFRVSILCQASFVSS